MTNFEKYKDDITAVGGRFGISCGKPMSCRLIKCDSCEIKNTSAGSIDCIVTRWEWLVSEYEEPKISIPKDTPIDAKILVSTDGIHWERRHYAGYENEKCYAWALGYTSWTAKYFLDGDTKQSWPYMKLALDENEEK